MDKMWNFLRRFWGEDTQKSEITENTPRRISLFRIIVEPLGWVIDHFKIFVLTAVWWALLLSLASFAFQHPYLCLYPEYREAHFCSESVVSYILMQLVLVGLSCCFMLRWTQLISGKKTLGFAFIARPQWADLKMWSAVILFILFNMVSILSAWLLYQRVPNPDYQIELVYFTVVGCGLLFPLIAMRFYSVLGFIAEREKVPSLRQIWKRGRGNNLRIMLGLGLIFLIAVFSLSAFSGEIRQIENKNTFYVGFIVEYLYSLLILLLSAFFINHCLLQKRYLFEREKDDQ